MWIPLKCRFVDRERKLKVCKTFNLRLVSTVIAFWYGYRICRDITEGMNVVFAYGSRQCMDFV